MGEMGEYWNDLREIRRSEKEKFGVPCAECVRLLPKAHPKILMPNQVCKMHNWRAPKRDIENDQ